MAPKKSGKKHYAKGLGDVTLNDFANSSVPKNRLKKSSNNVNIVVKQEVEKSWDAKEDEDFEGNFIPNESEDGTVSYVIKRIEPTLRKRFISVDHNGKDYPIDIWHILSDYIRPEDVGTFAAICKTSFDVVCTARFWFGLYRRYYQTIPNMPESLQPECLVRKYGLKTNVIRALYYMYPPFVRRTKPFIKFIEHPESLKKFECQLLWYTVKNRNHIYYFKMKKKIYDTVRHSRRKPEQPDLLEILDDISANPDEYCRVLEVTCLHMYPVPPVIGLTLRSVFVTTSSPLHYRLQLCFGSGINIPSKSTGGADSVLVILDPVINIKILDWWHPLYPCTYNIDAWLNQE